MGVLLSFVCGGDMYTDEIVKWLIEEGKIPNQTFHFGRRPTFAELRQIIQSNPNFQMQFSKYGSRDVIIATNSDNVLLCNLDVHSDDEPYSFYWKSGVQIMSWIAQEVADRYGSVIMWGDLEVYGVFHPRANTNPEPSV